MTHHAAASSQSAAHPAAPLVVFDLGRVLIRICDNWAQACDIARLPFPAALHDTAIAASVHERGNEFESGKLTHDAYTRHVASLVSAPQEHISKVVHTWLRGPFEGGRALIADLRSRDVRTACLSNTNATHWRQMHHDPANMLPLHQLDYRFASHLVGCMKPAAAIYQHVEDTAAVAPSSIIFFDDNTDNIAAARARHWQATQIDTTRCPITQMRHTLRELGVL